MSTPRVRTIAAAPTRSWATPRLRLSARLRLLPILIFTASLFLSVKIGLIWHESGVWIASGAIAISDAQAGSAKGAKAANAAVEPAAAETEAVEQPSAAGHAAGTPRDQHAATTSTGAVSTSRPATTEAKEPAFSPAEIEVLRQLAERRATLDARARELDKRDAVLDAAERRLDARVKSLKDLQAQVTALLKQHDAEQDTKMASLAKLYESMKPKDAAAILQTLELKTLLRVAERMKERKLAPIMAKMNPARARDVTMELVRLRAIESPAAVGTPAPRPGRGE